MLPRNVQKDPETALTWQLKDELLGRGVVVAHPEAHQARAGGADEGEAAHAVGLDGPLPARRRIRGIEISADVERAATDGRATAFMCGLHHAREWPSAELPMEQELSRWLAVWGAPGL